MASPVYVKADLTIDNNVLLCVRMPQIKKRYIRVAWRVAGENATAGAMQAFLTMDAPMIDLFQRNATGTVTMPTGAMDQSMGVSASGILDS